MTKATARDVIRARSKVLVLLNFGIFNVSISYNIFKVTKVTMYTTRTCPFCKMQIMYLDRKGVVYEQILVDEHPEEIEKMISISGQMGVPFTVIDKDNGDRVTILGFDQSKLDKVLGK